MNWFRKDIILIGGGGHALSIIDSMKRNKDHHIIGILDTKEKKNMYVSGVRIIGEDKDLEYYFYMGIRHAVISIGSIKDISPRRRIYETCKKIGYTLPNIIDKSAVVSKNIRMGEGNFIGKGAIINAKVQIGNGCIINTGAILEHGSQVEDFVHIAPGSVLCGNVCVKENTHIGANSTVLQNITIGADTIVGAGSVVLKDVSSKRVGYGNPFKEVR